MKNRTFILGIIAATTTLLYSCQDFISTNLSKKSITVLAPANNTVSTNYTQTFWWETLKGADSYNYKL